MNKRLVQLILGVAVSAVLVGLVLRMIDMSALTAALAVADIRLIPIAIVLYLLAMVIRSIMWRRLLPGPRTTTRTLFRVSIVGFAVNYAMPVRVGEFARAYLLSRWCGVSYGTTFASLVGERVLDGLSVSIIMLVSLAFIQAPGYVVVLGVSVAAIFGGLTAALLIVSWKSGGLVWVSTQVGRHLPVRLRYRIDQLSRSFAAGLQPLRSWRTLPLLMGLSVLGWICQFAVFYVLMLAFPFRPSFPLAMLSGGVANFATLLPSAPGYVGAFDASIVKLLIDIQGVSLEYAAAYALIVHTVLVIPIVILGAFVLWRADMSFGQVMRGGATARGAQAAAAVVVVTD